LFNDLSTTICFWGWVNTDYFRAYVKPGVGWWCLRQIRSTLEKGNEANLAEEIDVKWLTLPKDG